MKIPLKVAIATAILASIGGAGSAATTSFAFGCGGGVTCDSSSANAAGSLNNAFSLSEGGLSVTASAGYYEGGLFLNSNPKTVAYADPRTAGAKIGRYQGGAGVFSVPDHDHTIDGYRTNNDFIQLTFSEEVSLASISLGFVRPGSGFWLLADTAGDDGKISAGDWIEGRFDTGVTGFYRGTSTTTLKTGLFSSVWQIAAFGNRDSFKLSSVTVDTLDTLEAVPLPAAGLLLLAGLGGLGAMSRRKRKAA